MPKRSTQDSTGVLAPEAGGREEEIVAIAASCFERFGVQRTRVEDVAEQAGISRVYFYQFFKSRDALVDAVVRRQLGEIVDRIGPDIWKIPTAQEALVEGAVTVVAACRDDTVLMEILRRTNRARISELSLHSTPLGRDMLQRLWEPVLVAARERGELREELTDDANITAWLGSVLLLFLLREDPKPEEIRQIVGSYVAPGLLVH